jgi:hypothetical protein
VSVLVHSDRMKRYAARTDMARKEDSFNVNADRKRFWLGILTSLDNDQFLII